MTPDLTPIELFLGDIQVDLRDIRHGYDRVQDFVRAAMLGAGVANAGDIASSLKDLQLAPDKDATDDSIEDCREAIAQVKRYVAHVTTLLEHREGEVLRLTLAITQATRVLVAYGASVERAGHSPAKIKEALDFIGPYATIAKETP